MIRCIFFVKEILEEVKRNGGYIGKKPGRVIWKNFPVKVLEAFSYREDQGIFKFVAQMNELVDGNVYKKLNYKVISQWLKANNFLQEKYDKELNKTVTIPTEKGIQLGIRAEKRSSSNGVEYMLIVYNRQAQEYIVRNMEKILGGEMVN